MGKLYQKYLEILIEDKVPDFLQKYLEVPSLLRLKKIGYFCGMDYASKDIYHFKEKITRFDHSLTTALLTWRYTHDKKATIAALFHDVATPCFAHVIDYMNKDYENQESTEEYTKHIITTDDKLKLYLLEDEISIDEISDFKKYSIVDNDRPKLCADRFDGIILTGLSWTKEIGEKEIEELVGDLTVYKNESLEEELGFKTEEIAKKALEISSNIDYFCHSKEDNFMMELLAKITKTAILNGIVTYEELYILDEEELINRMKRSNVVELVELLDSFQNMKIENIKVIQLDNVKIRDLNPLVGKERIKTLIEKKKVEKQEEEVRKIVENLKEPISYLNQVMEGRLKYLEQEVNFLIENKMTSTDRLERTLDSLLDLTYWYGDRMRTIYYRLLSYYQNIDLEASLDYEQFYLEAVCEEMVEKVIVKGKKKNEGI